MTTKEQILECFKDIDHAYNDCTRYDTLKCMLDELQKPCEPVENPDQLDCISRQAVIDALCSDCELYKDGKRTCFTKCEEYHFLTTLPPVVTKEEQVLVQRWRDNRGISMEEFEDAMDALRESKIGHWIDGFGGSKCSECGCLEAGHSDYCPNCGANMVEPHESEEV